MNRIILFLFFAGSCAHGSIILGNLGHTAGSNISPQSTFWIAQKFTTGASAASVGSVTIRGAKHASHSNNMLYIYGDTGSGVGSQLYGFDASSMTATVSEQTFALTSGSGVLSASTDYWLAFAPDNVNTGLWAQTSDANTSDGTGAIPRDRAFSSTSGSSWNNFSPQSSSLMFELNAIPEPSMLAFALMGLLGLRAARQRFRMKA
ncbi:MAG: hypothetical protein PF795_08690 [Kiritimatiellae bacterium]|jgi:hypothetical protein|nr:hypothetical protein [Kiritimatiellia bacterium]